MPSLPRTPRPSPATPSSTCTSAARWRSRSTVALDGRDDLSMAYTPGVARVCEAIAADPALVDDYTWVSNTVAVVTDGTAVLGPRRHRPGRRDAGDGGQGGAVQAVRRRRRRADLPGHHRTSTRSSRPSPGSRRASAASTSRTSRRRAASRSSSGSRRCSTSRSSTTTSTAPPSWRSPRSRTRCASPAGRSASTRVVISGAGAAGVAVARILLAAGRRATSRSTDRRGVLHSGRGDLTPVKQALAVDTADRTGRTGPLADVMAGADVYIGVSGGTVPEEVVATMADRRDRLRAGEPDPRGAPRGRPPARPGRRDRPLGLPEPDQQRAGVPRHLPRRVRRPGHRDHRGHEARGRRRAGRRWSATTSPRTTSSRRRSTRGSAPAVAAAVAARPAPTASPAADRPSARRPR